MSDNLADRVAVLETRVTDLESRAGQQPAPTASTRGQGEVWALDGVRDEYGSSGGVVFAGVVTLGERQKYEWQEQFAATSLLEEGEGFDVTATALAALGHPIRLRLLAEVLRGRTEAGELVKLEGFGTSGLVYHHANTLIASGWLRRARRGHYAVPPGRVIPVLVALAVGGGQRS